SSDSATDPAAPYRCEHPPYTPQIISTSPLIIYLHNFTTRSERAHLRQKTNGTFRRSAITSPTLHSSIRTSTSTYIPSDPILSCIESRALTFQGHDIPPSHLEPLQLVRYLPGEHYSFHTDWFGNPAYSSPSMGGNRKTSFFAYLYVSEDMIGGGTNFPMIPAKRDERWCGILDCDAEYEKGITFRAVEGNAVFWENLREDKGGGDERVIHAGLPVVSGEKIGMNVWTREGAVGEEGR
ncbi:oxidoreductase, partial [Immersiella caudata]